MENHSKSQKEENNMSKELIDDVFYVEEKKWGTWDSYDKDDKCIITSFTKQECINATRWYLKMKQEDKLNSVETTYEVSVSGKL